ncbi:MAG TPA: HAMP domain-containing sensor histidine kinase [Streptosporangiaceae bacterium]|nr:HAMP domain-containing sensor histidine kinase [Streptosporangiaceae bacterium]
MRGIPRLPAFAQTIRFRLTVLYSMLLCALAALVVGGIYIAVSKSTEADPITNNIIKAKKTDIYGQYIGDVEVVKLKAVEQAVNFETMQNLRNYSFGLLGGLFVVSLGIGWMLSGRALRPVRAIVQTAEEIQATDLSRRIRLRGPKDELRYLGDTVDSMLDRLDAAFRAQRQLIDDASHELRTPLTVIRTNLDAVLIAADSTDEERRRAAAVIDRATDRMIRLVDDLLASARRSAPAFDDTDVDLAAVAREAAEEFEPLAARRGLVIDRTVGADLILIGDHDALRRAVGNLLSNAVRVAPAGSTVTVGAGRRDGWLWVAVNDAGPGIGPGEQARVFDRFWRRPNGEQTGAPTGDRGTGLGLAIVRQIIEAHGGQARLFSAVGRGSTFVLWLPAADAGESAPPDVDPLGALPSTAG